MTRFNLRARLKASILANVAELQAWAALARKAVDDGGPDAILGSLDYLAETEAELVEAQQARAAAEERADLAGTVEASAWQTDLLDPLLEALGVRERVTVPSDVVEIVKRRAAEHVAQRAIADELRRKIEGDASYSPQRAKDEFVAMRTERDGLALGLKNADRLLSTALQERNEARDALVAMTEKYTDAEKRAALMKEIDVAIAEGKAFAEPKLPHLDDSELDGVPYSADVRLVMTILDYESDTFSSALSKPTRPEAEEIARRLVRSWSAGSLDGIALTEWLEEIRDEEADRIAKDSRMALPVYEVRDIDATDREAARFACPTCKVGERELCLWRTGKGEKDAYVEGLAACHKERRMLVLAASSGEDAASKKARHDRAKAEALTKDLRTGGVRVSEPMTMAEARAIVDDGKRCGIVDGYAVCIHDQGHEGAHSNGKRTWANKPTAAEKKQARKERDRERVETALSVACPFCYAGPKSPCVNLAGKGTTKAPHKERFEVAFPSRSAS